MKALCITLRRSLSFLRPKPLLKDLLSILALGKTILKALTIEQLCVGRSAVGVIRNREIHDLYIFCHQQFSYLKSTQIFICILHANLFVYIIFLAS